MLKGGSFKILKYRHIYFIAQELCILTSEYAATSERTKVHKKKKKNKQRVFFSSAKYD